MAKIDKKLLREEVLRSKKKDLASQAYKIAANILEEKKKIYIKNIKNHPVSKELQDGPDADNSSKTLDGPGNLFSFIGFSRGSSPLDIVISEINNNTSIKERRTDKEDFEFLIETPNLEELESITPMPFEPGNSWLKGIEKGISGFSNYIYGLFNNSRSGRGIQSKNKVRKVNYKPVKFFSILYNQFIKSFNR